MKSLLASAAAIVSMTAAALAQVTTPQTLTMTQIQALNNGLQLLDSGSADQCAKSPVPASSTGKPASTTPEVCPYIKTTPLVVAMAEDMLALQGPLTAFQTEQNTWRKAILSDSKLKDDQQRNAEFLTRTQELLATKVPIYGLQPITLDELNLGNPPDHNRLSATTLAALAPIIPSLENQTPQVQSVPTPRGPQSVPARR